MVAAYLRISTGRQHLENQKDEILRYAASKNIEINRWVTEIVSGKKESYNRELGKLLKSLKSGDTLIVTEISRLSRTLHEIMHITGKCLERNITIYSTKDGYSFDDSINSKVLSFAFGLVAEIEHKLISQRTKEALNYLKCKGVRLGRKPGSDVKIRVLSNNRKEVLSLIRRGLAIGDICDRYGVSRDTFRRYRQLDVEVDALLIRRNMLSCMSS